MLAIVQTGVLAAVWWVWWKLFGTPMLKSSATGYSIRERFSSGVGVVFWNLTFLSMLIWIWGIFPTWLIAPFVIIMAICAAILSGWSKSKE